MTTRAPAVLKTLTFIKIHRKYSFVQERQPTIWESDFFVSSYWAVSYKTRLVLFTKFMVSSSPGTRWST